MYLQTLGIGIIQAMYHIPLGSIVKFTTKKGMCFVFLNIALTCPGLGVRSRVQFVFQCDVERAQTVHSSLFPGRVELLAARRAPT